MDVSTGTLVRQINEGLMKLGRNLQWLSNKSGIQYQKLHNWLNGVNKPRNESDLARVAEIIEHELAEQGDSRPVRVARAIVRRVPIYGGQPAGSPISYTGDVSFLDMVDWGNATERWGRVISGNSMEPEILHNDVVIFETLRVERFHVVHAYNLTTNTDTCKVFDGNMLRSVNPDYEDIEMSDGDVWTVNGVARTVIRDMGQGTKLIFEYATGKKVREFLK